MAAASPFTAGALAQRPLLTWVLLLLFCGLAQAALWSFSEPAWLFSDFYKAYFPVSDALWRRGPQAPWPLAETGAGSFVNLPIVGWLFVPFAMLGERESSWAFLVFGAVCTLAAWWLVRRLGPRGDAVAPAVLLLFAVNGPLVNSLREGNTTHVMLLLLVVALLSLQAGRPLAAGVVLGLCALIKLPLLLFGLYFLVMRRWRVVAGGALAIGGAALLSLLVHGIDTNVAWYRDSVAPFLGGVIPGFNVQSIDGFLMRLSTGVSLLQDWEPHQPTTLHRVVRLAIVAALLVGSGWLMRRADPGAGDRPAQGLSRRDAIEFCLVLCLALAISPISWSHYYLLLLLPMALQLGGATGIADGPRSRPLFVAACILVSLPIVIPPLSGGWLDELAARTLVSLWLFGGLMLAGVHAHALWRLGSLQQANAA